ncbi:sigma-54-dependent transcriptional regulator [Thiorhodococcus minor]|uniref:Sigma-54-dependent Fis family transcriptional regulator n=1 Tax=Thiorhodococcus minor TaxID=57489 RepID=A0A6M0K1C1_9GAMM|nr:sigma-54 dependent transcriptional regulator [Thiorhodococcus minor]NEV63546.1 sigma-54-dependent Fis family transcriptional regulator [Thiorhodococcus minor]
MTSQPLESRGLDRARDDRPAPDAGDSILIVDDEPEMLSFIERALAPHFARVETAADAGTARTLARDLHFDLMIVDIRLQGSESGLALAREIRDRHQVDLDVIFVTGYADVYDESDALRDASADVLRKPFLADQLLAMIQRARERRRAAREQALIQREHDRRPVAKRIVGESESLKEIWRTIHRLAPMPSTVLIKGETGTGKELVARALHDLSGRRGSYVPVNCGAISADLIEGELFGHLRGSFTGAHQARNGLFSHADGGTLFLDEIGEMPLPLQAKLLRVLEERRYRPVGGNQEIPINARVIAATNRDLAAEVLAGRFRKDLYYRINVVDLRVPPLRERRGDIPFLAGYFLNVLSTELGVPNAALSPWDLEQLMGYDWPGNCRELRNVIERSLLLGKPVAHLLCVTPPQAPGASESDLGSAGPASLEQVQRAHILSALAAAGGNRTVAARALGVSRKTVERKLKEWSQPDDVSVAD